MAFAARSLLAGPLVPAVFAGLRVGETLGWPLGAVSAYTVLALAQVAALAWTAAWNR
jgi:hypothetical protein